MPTPTVGRSLRLAAILVLFALAVAPGAVEGVELADGTASTVSFDRQIRPIFQANCQGCHQSARTGGGYVMTAFDQLLNGGESGLKAIVPGQPEESYLLDQITPCDGQAEMPRGKPPLSESDRNLIQTWIALGAVDDTPSQILVNYDQDHPPVYPRPPVIAALDFSPDGQWLAVAGFHEVLLWKADGSELAARLVGPSDRIQSLRFSPDGDRLAVAGGQPGRKGELQVWDLAERKLALNVSVTSDTLYGASWSPDGKLIAFGCGDNSVRAIGSRRGRQVLFMGSHSDWPLDTTFSPDGSHLISVSRDMSVKLTEVATQRFIDNITSITPGALKGGISGVARHPKRDEIVIGGSDGIPKIYRIFRQEERKIGDDANLIAALDAMPGRINDVDLSADGRRIALGSSLDGTGQVTAYAYEFSESTAPEAIQAILAKEPGSRTPQERTALNQAQKESIQRLSSTPIPQGAVYAVAVRPDGQVIAAAGGDGTVRLIDPQSGSILTTFAAAPVSDTPPVLTGPIASAADLPPPAVAEALPEDLTLTALEVQPEAVSLHDQFEYTQLIVTGRLATGETVDVTRLVTAQPSEPVVDVTPGGIIHPRADGQASLRLTLGDQSVEVPVTVDGMTTDQPIDFIRDVSPILSRLGCNQGTCHGSAKGKNGFKLSLRGYDPLFDLRALTDDLASRRVNVASPEDSLMLLKPTAAVPHLGGQVLKPGEPYYEVLRRWIASGAKLNRETPRVTHIEVSPVNPVIQRINARQQLRVLATSADGRVRDVTREAFLESGNIEIVKAAGPAGLMTALRRGEAPVLARFEGAYASTILTVMGDRSGFEWQEPPAYNRIDELVARKWERLKIQSSGTCTDAEFLRRASLDLTGLPPTAAEVRDFLNDPRDARLKREELVNTLVGSDAFVDYWTNKWADLLQVNRKFLGVEGSVAFRAWIRDQVARNVPYDQFVRSILTANGSNKENPAASYFKVLREPTAIMETTTQLFLAVRFNCNKCHDHPFERWTQDQYYQTAAYFAQVALEDDPASAGKTISGTEVEKATTLYEIITDIGKSEVIHDRTQQPTSPKFPFEVEHETPAEANRRQELAAWLTSPENPYFARSYVNRLWGYLLGVGIIEPLDDIRAGNPATNSELLDYLTKELIASGFDTRHIIKLITNSRTYQLSIETNRWNEDDRTNASHAIARRLPAEVLLDAVYRVTGSRSTFPEVPPGTRAAALPDVGIELPSGFLSTFGRPARESACECERSSGLQLGPIMALVSGPTLADAIADPENALTKLVADQDDNSQLIQELFLRILNRPATPEEVTACLRDFALLEEDNRKLAETLAAKESEFAQALPTLEQQRTEALAAAESALADFEKELAPKRAEQERQQAELTAQLEENLKDYVSALPARLAEWEKSQTLTSPWQPLRPQSVSDTNKAAFTEEDDGSVIASGESEPGVITFVAETDLKEITGIRIELIADDRLPARGPGRSEKGNLVLSEFQVTAAPKSDPSQTQNVRLQEPRADFSQKDYDISLAIDGKTDGTFGWAIEPAIGLTHWATFESREEIGFDSGTVLTFKLFHHRDQGLMPGRFRISVTRLPRPIGLDLAEEYRTILAITSESRTEAQHTLLRNYLLAVDPEWRRRAEAVAKSRAPLPEDPRLKELRNQIDEARKPVPLDPDLVQVRQDVEQSRRQADKVRLTVAQDIAWALINSPAFLFNH